MTPLIFWSITVAAALVQVALLLRLSCGASAGPAWRAAFLCGGLWLLALAWRRSDLLLGVAELGLVCWAVAGLWRLRAANGDGPHTRG